MRIRKKISFDGNQIHQSSRSSKKMLNYDGNGTYISSIKVQENEVLLLKSNQGSSK